MRLKLLIISVIYLLVYSFFVRDVPLDLEKDPPVSTFEKKFDDFELSLNKVFVNGSLVDGESSLIEKINISEKLSSQKISIEESCEELSRWLKPPMINERFGKSSLYEVSRKESDVGLRLTQNLYLKDGLSYAYNKNWTFVLNVQNPLGWLQSKDEENLTSNNMESTVLLTCKFSF